MEKPVNSLSWSGGESGSLPFYIFKGKVQYLSKTSFPFDLPTRKLSNSYGPSSGNPSTAQVWSSYSFDPTEMGRQITLLNIQEEGLSCLLFTKFTNSPLKLGWMMISTIPNYVCVHNQLVSQGSTSFYFLGVVV